jgi:hypothetical protein
MTTAVAARRGFGEDSIYWHEAKGRYVGAISLGYGPKGKRIRKSVTGKTKAEVRDKLKELHRQLDEGTASSPTYRVDQAVAAWLASVDLDPSTVANYRFMAKHVTNGLGDRRLRDLTAKDIQGVPGRAPRVPGHLRKSGPGEGVDAAGAASLVREHAVGRWRGDRGHLAPGRPFQHADDRTRLPARAEARAQDRCGAHGPDLRQAIMNLAVSLAVR